ncbi:MAG TPA: methylenetetrahydrofolate--tRNA-(uracil(54)-C(5))-methyltransferase (FADH(2)-oxidizing) TrmFO [bacterium]|nr:methylenetetrahydrofolate--tRNA-(uracil(54)-C(5))-methyltransferase (FADH(2)-oxidizing) TrmFO [bacterium]
MRGEVAVVGAGLAGSEAAWQLARRGVSVDVFEMRPLHSTEAHRGGDCAELVCSNSFKSLALENAHGLLKAELAVQDSLILQGALQARVPAGQALAVDRVPFARWITARLAGAPRIALRREEAPALAPLLQAYRCVIVASGPLTSAPLAEDLARTLGTSHLYFHDAIAPVLAADSVDRTVAFRAARYGKGEADYWNCPLDEAQYRAFVEQVLQAQRVPLHGFESLRPFEGCLPIEVMAERGPLTLAFGPMKPVGLADPRTGRRPFAVVQLRQEDQSGTLLGMVGFQTKMTWPEQRRIFRTIPGLERAEFVRLGSLHRNTFLNAPLLLDADLAWRGDLRLRFAGQITGVEGYTESAAMGLYAAKRAAAWLAGRDLSRPSRRTMTGALLHHVTQAPAATFQPMNAAFGLLEPLPEALPRATRKRAYAQRALREMEALERLEFGAAWRQPALAQALGLQAGAALCAG